jgi:hypothetical protein
VNFRENYPTALVLTSLFLLFTGGISAQESSSNPAAQATSPNGPIAALRNLLTAACSENQSDFQLLLTVRNKESFTHMAPAARVAFMKRFVLLNEPGKPSVTTNPSGRPTVRCETPEGAAELQIAALTPVTTYRFSRLRDARYNRGRRHR